LDRWIFEPIGEQANHGPSLILCRIWIVVLDPTLIWVKTYAVSSRSAKSSCSPVAIVKMAVPLEDLSIDKLISNCLVRARMPSFT
jgi:hypothetical protein